MVLLNEYCPQSFAPCSARQILPVVLDDRIKVCNFMINIKMSQYSADWRRQNDSKKTIGPQNMHQDESVLKTDVFFGHPIQTIFRGRFPFFGVNGKELEANTVVGFSLQKTFVFYDTFRDMVLVDEEGDTIAIFISQIVNHFAVSPHELVVVEKERVFKLIYLTARLSAPQFFELQDKKGVAFSRLPVHYTLEGIMQVSDRNHEDIIECERTVRCLGRIHYIQADGHHVTVEDESPPDLKKMQAFVEGHIDITYGLYNGKTCQIVVNDDGHVHGLPINEKATRCYRDLSRSKGNSPSHSIAGNAIILEDCWLE